MMFTYADGSRDGHRDNLSRGFRAFTYELEASVVEDADAGGGEVGSHEQFLTGQLRA